MPQAEEDDLWWRGFVVRANLVASEGKANAAQVKETEG